MFGKKPAKRPIRPGEKFDKRVHVDRRQGERRQTTAKTRIEHSHVRPYPASRYYKYLNPKTGKWEHDRRIGKEVFVERSGFQQRERRKRPDRRQKGLRYRVKELWRKISQPGSDKTAR